MYLYITENLLCSNQWTRTGLKSQISPITCCPTCSQKIVHIHFLAERNGVVKIFLNVNDGEWSLRWRRYTFDMIQYLSTRWRCDSKSSNYSTHARLACGPHPALQGCRYVNRKVWVSWYTSESDEVVGSPSSKKIRRSKSTGITAMTMAFSSLNDSFVRLRALSRKSRL